MLYQLVSMVGAAMILAAFYASQRGRLGREDRLYNALNFVGSALLTWIATVDQRWGFIVLEGSWALLSLWPLLRPPKAPNPT